MSRRRTVVYTGPEASAPTAANVLGDGFELVAVQPSREALDTALEKAEALLDASMAVPISADLIARASTLRVISTATTGASHIDVEALEARGVSLLTLKGQRELLRELTPAAEHSWLLLMACARKLVPAVEHTVKGGWDRTLFPGPMLRGSTLGIIGLGRIGGWMARYASAFGMIVQAYDPLAEDVTEGVALVELDYLLSTSDFVTLHVNLDPENRGMLGAAAIGAMKHGAMFINTSRAELTDEDALVSALESGQLAAVGVDVLASEPDPSASALWRYAQDHDNVVITPHIGGFSPASVDITVGFAARRIRDYLDAS